MAAVGMDTLGIPPADSGWLNFKSSGPLEEPDWTGTEQPWPLEQPILADHSPIEISADSRMRVDTPLREDTPMTSVVTATSGSREEVNPAIAIGAIPVVPRETKHGELTVTTLASARACDIVEKGHTKPILSASIPPSGEPIAKAYTDDTGASLTRRDPPSGSREKDGDSNDHDNLMNELNTEADVEALDEELADAEVLGLTPKYELRPAARGLDQAFLTTWIDEDETGNYNPSEEHRKMRSRRQHPRPQRKHKIAPENDLDNCVLSHTDARERILPKLVVKLKFWSEAAKKAIQLCLSKPSAHALLEHDDFSEGYRLRRKHVHRPTTDDDSTHRDGDVGVEHDHEDLTGHPEARGCRGCLRLGIRCPLLDNEYGWPCQACREDDTDCELVTEPASKRGCENCRRKRISCSFNYQTDHHGPCQDCEEDGRSCIAGPAKDAIRPRLRYDRDWTATSLLVKKPVKARTRLTCAQCCEARRECSFSTGAPGSECTACEMEGNICVVMEETVSPAALSAKSVVQQQATKRKSVDEHDAGSKRAEKQRQPPSRRDSKMYSSEARRPKVKKKMITTRFSHPIVFNCEAVDGAPPCNFCDESFAILGLEPREVEVIEREDRGGFTERKGGYHSEGWPNTSMCTTCTMRRMNIACCSGHSLRPTNGNQPVDSTNAINALFQGKIRKRDRWCRICPSIASYECEAAGCLDAYGKPRNGCGLHVCETCKVELTGLHDGSLHEMLTGLKDGPSDQRPLGLRADAEFLKLDGLLMQHLLRMA